MYYQQVNHSKNEMRIRKVRMKSNAIHEKGDLITSELIPLENIIIQIWPGIT